MMILHASRLPHLSAPIGARLGWTAGMAIFLSIANVGCGKVREPVSAFPSGPAKPVAFTEVDESLSITGRVSLIGGMPSALGAKIDVGGNPFCTQHGDLIDPAWKVSPDGGLADAVVYVADSTAAANIAAEPVLIDQKNCLFSPTMTAVQPGQTVRFLNSDLTFHNVRVVRHEIGTAGKGESLDNYAQPSMGGKNDRVFAEPGIYRIECDVHRWMRAWVFVNRGCRHAVSGPDGKFAINRSLPDGGHTVRVWHPQFPRPAEKSVTVNGGRAAVDFDFKLAEAFRP